MRSLRYFHALLLALFLIHRHFVEARDRVLLDEEESFLSGEHLSGHARLHVKAHTQHSHHDIQQEDAKYKALFSHVYDTQLWGPKGQGSGTGSTLEITEVTRAILRTVVANYSLQSMTDAPCGAMEWQPLMLEQIQEDNPGFQYLGVDVVESVIENNTEKFAAMDNWHFHTGNLVTQTLPEGYDLILSRDGLQHMPCDAIVSALHHLANAKPQYVLLGSYDPDQGAHNKNIVLGDYFSIDLRSGPFNLADGVIHVYDEKTRPDAGEPEKHLLLMTGSYLSGVDFAAMREGCKSI